MTCIFTGTILLGMQTAHAQSGTEDFVKNLRARIIVADSDTIQLDSLSILDVSFIPLQMPDEVPLSPEQYDLDWSNARLILKDPALRGASLKCIYRVFPYRFEALAFHKSRDRILEYTADSFYFNPYYYQPAAEKDGDIIDWGQLNYSGSFARGVSFGNSQSLALNSELDLQLTGYIGKDVEITAVLTDNNIPIQPDGNTAQIQDFDKVYIGIRKGDHELIAGDYEVREEESYFMRYYKQLQGASYSGAFDILPDMRLESSISFSIAKGQFTRNSFNGREGNQGPYRLTGSNGETFIIVLAGSEKVYIDNELLVRGEENDYVMDYNTGEITFTPNTLITREHRIVVEFEYADRNYFRTFIQTRHTLQYKKAKAWFKFYNEQDNKNNPINVSLDEEERELLSSIGDNITNAFIDGVNEVEYDAARVLYALSDTLVNGIVYDSIFLFSTDEADARYSLSFTYLGPGNGFYEPDINSANGRVFKWVAPDINGNPTGSYEPVILLVTPKKHQLMTLGATVEMNDHWTFTSEAALSNFDVNRFSDIGDGDDKDLGAQAELTYNNKIGGKDQWKMRSSVGYEYKGKGFEPIEPYRPVEFQRDWNLGLTDSSVNEHFVFGDLRFYRETLDLQYRFTTFQRSGIYSGYKNVVGFKWDGKGWRIKANGNVLVSDATNASSLFLRPDLLIEKDFAFWKGVTFGLGGRQEYNRITAPDTDSLLASSFVNNNLKAYIQSSDSSKVGWKVQYQRRVDKEDLNDAFSLATRAHTFEAQGDVRELKAQQLRWRVTYRTLQVSDTTLTDAEKDNSILGRLEYGFNVKKGAVRFNAIYELGSGQERQRDFTYLRVSSGEGIYSWIDQNSDGLQQQNEFVVSEFSDSASYIRVFTNFNEFIQTNVTKLDQSVYLQPKLVWNDASGIKGFIARFTVQSSLLISKKSLKDAGGSAFNPFVLTSGEENIVVVNASIRNALYFNRNSAKYKISYIQNWSQNKLLLLNGIDARQSSGHMLEGQWNVKQFLSLGWTTGVNRKIFNSQFFSTDDYNIAKYEVGSSAEYTWKTKIRTALRYEYGLRTNEAEFGGERADVHELRWDLKFSLVGKSTLLADFRYVQIGYDGETSSTKSYELLEGLKPGQNYLWNFRFDQKLARNIQLTMQYEGRKSGSGKVINTGRAQVRALF